jgi:hypothetical protein
MTERFRVNGTEACFNDMRFDLLDDNDEPTGFSFSITKGLSSFNWEDSIDRGEFRGPGPYIEDVSSGDYSGSGSQEWKRSAWARVEKQMGPRGGVYGLLWKGTLSYTDKLGETHTDVLTKCGFTKRSTDSKQGKEVLTKSVEFTIYGKVYSDGYGPLGEALGT